MKQSKGDIIGNRKVTNFYKAIFNKVTFGKQSEEVLFFWGKTFQAEGTLGSKALRYQRLGTFKEEQGYVDRAERAEEIMAGDEVTELGRSQRMDDQLLLEKELPGI